MRLCFILVIGNYSIEMLLHGGWPAYYKPPDLRYVHFQMLLYLLIKESFIPSDLWICARVISDPGIMLKEIVESIVLAGTEKGFQHFEANGFFSRSK